MSPKALVRAPSEQSKVYERLEESVGEKVNTCAAAASIITGTSRYFALSASLDPRSPRFEDPACGAMVGARWGKVQPKGGASRRIAHAAAKCRVGIEAVCRILWLGAPSKPAHAVM